jgi:hypothetical protein
VAEASRTSTIVSGRTLVRSRFGGFVHIDSEMKAMPTPQVGHAFAATAFTMPMNG